MNIRREVDEIIRFIRKLYPGAGFLPLHAPLFRGNEEQYLLETLRSTFVSSVGPFVNRFEEMICDYTGAGHAVAVVNGTAALHVALQLGGVKRGDLVLTQALSFVATCNAISYLGAEPLFIDIDHDTFGLSANKLETYLREETIEGASGRGCVDRRTGRTVSACVPMHTFGFPAKIEEIRDLCDRYRITLIEDAAESLGSLYRGRHTGTFGEAGIFSFNGNKTITCGGGGIIVTNNRQLAEQAKHLTTQAKRPHPWRYEHDQIGYNYRCPNLNAALACAQLEQIEEFIENKRQTAGLYHSFFEGMEGVEFVSEPAESRSNYWLNAIMLPSTYERDLFLEITNREEIGTRPVWTLLNRLPIYSHCRYESLEVSEEIEERLVNLPSSVRIT